MPPRVTGVLISATLASGLLIAAAPAQAVETKNTAPTLIAVQSAAPQPDTHEPQHTFQTSAPTQSADPSHTPLLDETAESNQPAPRIEEANSNQQRPAENPSESQSQTETVLPGETLETVEPTTAPSAEPAPEQTSPDPTSDSSQDATGSTQTEPPAQAPVETSVPEAPQLLETPRQNKLKSFGYIDGGLTKEQQVIIEKLENNAPEDADDWSDAQWEEFWQSDEGIEYNRLLEELEATYPQWEDDVSDKERELWEKIESLIPEGSEYWDESQWEAFYKTEEGKEFDRLYNEYQQDYWDYIDEDEGFELSDEERKFYEEIERLSPEGSEEWDEEQWNAYFVTDEGRHLLELSLSFAFDTAESPEELKLIIESFREYYADASEWFEDFMNRYLGTPSEEPKATPTTDAESLNTTPGQEVPTKSDSNPAATVVKAVAQRTKHEPEPVAKKQPAEQHVQDELAKTGFNSLILAGGSVLVILLGAFSLRLARRSRTR
ncbi:hypothetical protein ACT3UD_13515 [Glutamicibacter sp. 287]|uniref:hypothetical protein n=1 Tax=unclassified Glutamicibacter TaxID=2627139 RepID=UPI000BB9AA2C|nr:hypothetical protein [Glutamicibacter sp. BW80]PCC27780.1 hypothetical protein CIK76_15105 [Glutamicibacter sp. BW80]